MAEHEQENEQLDEIPSVGDDDQQKKNKQFLIGMVFLVVASIIVLAVAASGDDENKAEEGSLEAQVAKEYEVAQRNLVIPKKKEVKKIDYSAPILPKANAEPVIKQPILARPTQSTISKERNLPVLTRTSETREEEKARKKQEQLWEKRRKANPVVYDKAQELKESESRFAGGDKASRHVLDIDKLTNNVTSKLGNISSKGSLTGGANKNELETRLNSAKTVGVTASYIADKPYTIAEGKMLGCVLETAIQSNLPGMTRCVLSENIFSYDGKQMLLRKGSRLVGQYDGGIQQGESRIFVIWTRIITPEGIDISLNSPGTGELGSAGHGVQIDSHFFERFGASALLSIVGGLTAAVDDNNVRYQEVGKAFNKSSEIALKDSIRIKPTGYKNQGERIKVFVARDIDFAPVLKLARARLK